MASIKIDVDLGDLTEDYTVIVTFKKGEISALHYPAGGKKENLVVEGGGVEPSPQLPTPSASIAESPKKSVSSKKNMSGNMMNINI